MYKGAKTISWFHTANVLNLLTTYTPELEHQVGLFVDHYNNHRYHEALDNVTPADMYYGREGKVLRRRVQIKRKTMLMRRRQNCGLSLA